MSLFLVWSYDDNNLNGRNIKMVKNPHFVVILEDSEQYNILCEQLTAVYPNRQYGLYQLLNIFYPSMYHQNFDNYNLKNLIKFGQDGHFSNDEIKNELMSEFSFDIIEKLEKNKFPVMQFSIAMDYCYAIMDVNNEIENLNKKLEALFHFRTFSNVKNNKNMENPFFHHNYDEYDSLLTQFNNVQI